MNRRELERLLLQRCGAHVRSGSGWWVRRARALETVVTPPADGEYSERDRAVVDDRRIASAPDLVALREPLLRFDWWRQGAEEAVVASERLWILDPGGGTAFLTAQSSDHLASWVLLSAVHPADSARAWSAAVRDFVGAGCGRYYSCPAFDDLPSSTFNARPDLVPRAEVRRGMATAAGRSGRAWHDLLELYGAEGERLHPELAPVPTETWPPDTFTARIQRVNAMSKPERERLLEQYLRQTYRER